MNGAPVSNVVVKLNAFGFTAEMSTPDSDFVKNAINEQKTNKHNMRSL